LIVALALAAGGPAHDKVAAQGAVATAAPNQEAPIDPNTLFQYDNKAPLNVQVAGTEKRGDVTVQDVTFVGLKDPIKAYIVSPAGSGPFAGILYVHWLGDPQTTNRTEFLDEAVSLAPRGAVSVLIDAMWAAPGWYKARVPENDFDMSVHQVIELRRTMDLLAAQPNVDPKRLAFVGHDFGAMYGTLMGAVDQRPVTYVLMAATPSFIDWFLYSAQPKSLDAYKQQMSALDPSTFIKQIKAPVFFQFAQTDEYIPVEKALEFYSAANPPKQMATYETGHGMELKDVAADHIAWLAAKLNLK
jgi:dienelactone hydrolase